MREKDGFWISSMNLALIFRHFQWLDYLAIFYISSMIKYIVDELLVNYKY